VGQSWTTLAIGTGAVSSELDTTLLLNGIFALRLSAERRCLSMMQTATSDDGCVGQSDDLHL
jgi:hypothetical protein